MTSNSGRIEFYNLPRRCSVRIKIEYSRAAEADGEKAESVADFVLFLLANWRC